MADAPQVQTRPGLPTIACKLRAVMEGGEVKITALLSTKLGERMVAQSYDVPLADAPQDLKKWLSEIESFMVQRHGMHLYQEAFAAMGVATRLQEVI